MHYDLLIIGGGINGAAIANVATAAGLKIALCEQGDFSSATSSASTKMIHGGLRYLEHFAFSLVRESLSERERLLRLAPHLVRAIPLYMPDAPRLRSPLRIRAGLFCYNHLFRSQLPKAGRIHFPSDNAKNPLSLSFKSGFVLYDCQANDSRLVLENLLAVQKAGGELYPHHTFVAADRHADHWSATLKRPDGTSKDIKSRVIVNAAGPWVERLLTHTLSIRPEVRIRLVKGSHLVFPKFYEGNQGYLLQNIDGRFIFVLPFEDRFTMVGTTDILFDDTPSSPNIEPDEIYYLCDAVNRYFHHKLRPQDIIGSWSGVRPLLEDGSDNPSRVSRESRVSFQHPKNKAPIVSLFGGKLTTHLAQAERVLKQLLPLFPGKHYTEPLAFPGGKLLTPTLSTFSEQVQEQYPWLPETLRNRYIRNYGARLLDFLSGAKCIEDLGEMLGQGLYSAEIDFLIKNEWASSLEDILWRRTQLGFMFSDHDISKLSLWWQENIG